MGDKTRLIFGHHPTGGIYCGDLVVVYQGTSQAEPENREPRSEDGFWIIDQPSVPTEVDHTQGDEFFFRIFEADLHTANSRLVAARQDIPVTINHQARLTLSSGPINSKKVVYEIDRAVAVTRTSFNWLYRNVLERHRRVFATQTQDKHIRVGDLEVSITADKEPIPDHHRKKRWVLDITVAGGAYNKKFQKRVGDTLYLPDDMGRIRVEDVNGFGGLSFKMSYDVNHDVPVRYL